MSRITHAKLSGKQICHIELNSPGDSTERNSLRVSESGKKGVGQIRIVKLWDVRDGKIATGLVSYF